MPATNTNRTTRIIPLDIRSPNYPFIQFLRAEVNATSYAPFALIRYAIRGNESSKALRLDLDKRAFIDPQDLDPSQEFKAATAAIASVIAERIGRETFRWFAGER
jgi:hypothetical protein